MGGGGGENFLSYCVEREGCRGAWVNHSGRRDQDQILVNRAVAGDQKAFELLVRQYQGRVSSTIARMVADSDKARDLTQETFLKAYRALPNFRGDASFFVWLSQIAVNTTRNHFVSKGKEIPLSDMPLEDTDWAAPQWHDYETPERQVLRKEMLENLQAAMDTLVPVMKKAILLRDMQGLSYEEIAKILRCPVGTVRSRIFRGRQEIMDQMRGYLGTPPALRSQAISARGLKTCHES